jgi:competence protein ComEA
MADGRVILNVASEDELTKLPGIGPSRARAIVALRQRLAKFRAVEDLLRVKGIGRKTLRRLKPNVVLDRPPGGDAGTLSSTG